MKREQLIRGRALRGIALNRQPGFHFPGNFLDISFDRVARDASHLSLDPGAWCVDAGGGIDLGSLAILADLALAAATAGAALPPHWRLSGISAWYLSPGEGPALKARSTVVHHGRLSAVVRTQITGYSGKS